MPKVKNGQNRFEDGFEQWFQFIYPRLNRARTFKGLKGEAAQKNMLRDIYTSLVSGTHLDYEVWQNGKHTNPLEYLAKDAEEKARAEKAKKEAEEAKWRKEHPVQATVKDTTNLVKQAVSANNNSKSDKTGIKDFADRQNNTTNNLVNGGMR